MTVDETFIEAIPARSEDLSTDTPNVLEILRRWRRGRREHALFPGRTC